MIPKLEVISEVKVTDNNELHIKMEGSGHSAYQYIYREAKGVYWLNDLASFKFGPSKNWSVVETYRHVIQTVKEGLNLDLQLSEQTNWKNIAPQDRELIELENMPRT
ncbi:MAG: hypothetical protein HWE14_06945 [Flavobacteriia bacterium]|nr:hypothetical protein [Flavobacteriia bacterium]